MLNEWVVCGPKSVIRMRTRSYAIFHRRWHRTMTTSRNVLINDTLKPSYVWIIAVPVMPVKIGMSVPENGSPSKVALVRSIGTLLVQ